MHPCSASHSQQDGEGGAAAPAVDPDAVDADAERVFWANLTLNPPLYGADTPTSFFDDKLSYGWNLRNLGDLLQQHNVDAVPGGSAGACWMMLHGGAGGKD